MTHRFFITLSTSLLSLTALAGCPGSETEYDAKFAEATDAQLQRSFAASAGGDLESALLIGILFSGGASEPGACPTVTTDGQDTTVTGGCTTEDGDRWDGSIEIHNLPGFFVENPAYDPEAPSSVVFDLHIIPFGGGDEVDLSGSVEVAEGSASSDFTVDAEGIETTSRLTLECEDEGPCTAASGSEIIVEGLGGAAVEGTWSLGEEASGEVRVKGADTLVFDMASRDENGCVDYAIGDRTGQVCGEGDEPAFAPRSSWSDRIRAVR